MARTKRTNRISRKPQERVMSTRPRIDVAASERAFAAALTGAGR